MRKLIQGVREFQTQIFDAQRELFERLAQGQHPEALFITCADSRVDPNLLMQAVPGDLFVLRNAGNIVPPFSESPGGEAATIEFAVNHLAVREIIVCGHSRCGAMAGLLWPEKLAGLPSVAGWLKHAESAKRILRNQTPQPPDDELWASAIEENVLVQLDNLRTHPAVDAAVARGKLNLHGWVYHFESGQVVKYDAIEGRFVPLA